MRRLPIVLLLLLVMSAYADVAVVETVDTPAVAPLVGDALVAMAQRLQNIANESSEFAVLNETAEQEINAADAQVADDSIPVDSLNESAIEDSLDVSNESSVQEEIPVDVPTSQADENRSGDVVLDAQENASGDTPASVVVPLEEVFVPVEQTSVEVIETVDSPAQGWPQTR